MTDIENNDVIHIYTDGSCLGNPGPGGWGAVLLHPQKEKRLSGGYRLTTNNRMEMMAAIEALSALKKRCKVQLHTDSQYVKNGITAWMHSWKKKGWVTAAKKPVKNRDLWMELDRLINKHDVSWKWVKGHVGDKYNEIADQLAAAAANGKDLARDEGYASGS